MIDKVEKNRCCGCMACYNICPTNAISIIEDDEGFSYPKVDEEKCIKCGLCEKVCDFRKEHTDKNNGTVYAVKNKDNQIRSKSTSGGMYTALFENIISKKGVIYAAVLNENLEVEHMRCINKEECNRGRGSKYLQSNIANCYEQIKEDLKNGYNVLFTGTACQVQGIKSYLKLKKIDDSNLITCDFICHGVPSKKIFKDYISFLEEKYKSKVVDYKFRTKTKGWKGHHEEAILENNKIINSGKYINIYKEIYGSLCTIRKSCYNCPYASSNHFSDITIGDFWGIEEHKKDFSDNLGISFVMVNSEKGEKIFKEIEPKIEYINANINECRNPQLHHSVEKTKKREKFWKEYNEKGFKYIAKKYTTFGKIKLIKTYIYKQLIKIKNIMR